VGGGVFCASSGAFGLVFLPYFPFNSSSTPAFFSFFFRDPLSKQLQTSILTCFAPRFHIPPPPSTLISPLSFYFSLSPSIFFLHWPFGRNTPRLYPSAASLFRSPPFCFGGCGLFLAHVFLMSNQLAAIFRTCPLLRFFSPVSGSVMDDATPFFFWAPPKFWRVSVFFLSISAFPPAWALTLSNQTVP